MTTLVSRIFSPKVLARWQQCPEDGMRALAAAVAEYSPEVRCTDTSAEKESALAAIAALDAYLHAAQRIGLLKGQDLRRRLTSPDPAMHRGAVAECLAAWWLSDVLGLSLSPRPRGQGSKVLEYSAPLPEGDLHFETKAPWRRYRTGFRMVAEAEHIGAVVEVLGTAKGQFQADAMNAVVLIPSVDWSVRPAILKAFEEGDRLREIGAVLCLDYEHPAGAVETDLHETWRQHTSYVVRNRHALRPIPSYVWQGWPEYVGPDCDQPRRVGGSRKAPVETPHVRLRRTS